MSTPLILAYAGMALMLTLSCIGSAIGVTMAGNTTVAGLKKKPDMFGKAMLAAGIALGFVGLWSAIKQASLVSNGINEMSNGHDVFSRTMILAVFPELYAILAFACAFLALP